MDVSPIIDPLNDAQREAVTAQNDHLLVLAGALAARPAWWSAGAGNWMPRLTVLAILPFTFVDGWEHYLAYAWTWLDPVSLSAVLCSEMSSSRCSLVIIPVAFLSSSPCLRAISPGTRHLPIVSVSKASIIAAGFLDATRYLDSS